jgi:hypothetical protein
VKLVKKISRKQLGINASLKTPISDRLANLLLEHSGLQKETDTRIFLTALLVIEKNPKDWH